MNSLQRIVLALGALAFVLVILRVPVNRLSTHSTPEHKTFITSTEYPWEIQADQTVNFAPILLEGAIAFVIAGTLFLLLNEVSANLTPFKSPVAVAISLLLISIIAIFIFLPLKPRGGMFVAPPGDTPVYIAQSKDGKYFSIEADREPTAEESAQALAGHPAPFIRKIEPIK